MVAIVTGGASGIGEAIVRRFAEIGPVAIWDFNEDAATALAEELGVLAVRVDVSDRADVERALVTTREALGTPDVLVNNAGIREILPFLDVDLETWDRVLRVNLDGTFHCLQAFARLLIAEGATGAAVNVSSAAGLAGFPARSAYGASKHGVIGLTKAAAMELAPHGIRVNAIAPGFIYTPMTAHYEDDPGMVAFIESTTPIGRRGRAEEIADAVAYAASPGASFMTGSVLTVDGGLLAGVSGKAGPATSVS